MQYKTIILHLVETRPEMQERLRREGQLLPKIESLAKELKDGHDHWKETLSQMHPTRGQDQLSAQALEMSLHDLETCLRIEFPAAAEESSEEPLSLDEAMAFARRHAPPA